MEEPEEDLVLLRRNYPHLNRGELIEAKENLDRYFDLAVRIWRRLEQERPLTEVDASQKNSYDSNAKVESLTQH